ncbi:YbaB/EbfC family nucleoid-associated protein [Reichenbachiella agariperforans]|uniref:YbaB/EbfC family nucleoid-associated protein n=1 Tax=Reichenbachiella agariperforans TaxID=156994 RepID=UPI001C09B768|nr:YbaB/EbfC family nucleoid-associated protein [Reichenbachiella agariperforans]MBU2913340.1 YbaB/EbfC family nucleoid-associated protein [Reichenbachiella agariperforans]
MFDMMKMMGKVKEMQSKMKEVQAELAQIEVEGESGAGLVKALVNGQKKLIKVDIDESLVNTADKEVLQDLIVAAVNKATDEADIKAKEYMKEHTKGLMPNIPGFDLGNMFNA